MPAPAPCASMYQALGFGTGSTRPETVGPSRVGMLIVVMASSGHPGEPPGRYPICFQCADAMPRLAAGADPAGLRDLELAANLRASWNAAPSMDLPVVRLGALRTAGSHNLR